MRPLIPECKVFSPTAALLFMLIGIAAFAQVLTSYFLADDFFILNSIISSGPLTDPWASAGGPGFGFLRPVVSFFFWLDHAVWGLSPAGYHLTNIVIHGINAYLVALLCSALLDIFELGGRNDHTAVFSGLVFLLHPSHAESVSWISGRTDVIAAFFFLASVLAICRYLKKPSAPLLALAGLSAALSFFSKESAVFLPSVLTALCAAFWHFRRSPGMRRMLPYITPALLSFAVLAVYFLVRLSTLGSLRGGYASNAGTPFISLGSVAVLVRHSVRALIPAFPKAAYGLFAYNEIILIVGFIAGAVSAAVAGRLRSLSRRELAFLAFCCFCFLCSLCPAATLKSQIFSSEGERLVYIPSVFISIILSFACLRVLRSRKLRCCAAALLIFFYSGALQIANSNWACAARVSRSVIDQIAAIDTSDVILLNLPDNYRGAYMFRMGLQEAVALNGRKFQSLRVCVYHDVLDLDDQISLELDPASRVIHVRLPDRNALIRGISQAKGVVAVEQEDLHSSSIKVLDAPPGCGVFFYDRGVIRPFRMTAQNSG